MISMSEINGLDELNISKGKVPRPYLNINNKDYFYIVFEDKRIAKVELEINDGTIDNMTIFNDHDDTSADIDVSKITVIDSEFGIIMATINRNIIYFSKPSNISLYA